MSIKISSLTKIYGEQKAVDDISFELAKGEVVGFLGPNGAGKSTTMKMITGYLPPSRGNIAVCGFDVEQQAMEVRRRVGYLPESNPLYTDMYVREYLEFSAGIHQLSKPKQRIEEMISLTGLNKEAHKKIRALSKGYKQRVGLAQAILHDPEVLILDEPTSGLDPNQIVEIRELILQIGKAKTILLSTHIMQEVQAMCSRVIIINNGKIAADDTIDGLQKIQSPQDTLMVHFVSLPSKEKLNQLRYTVRYENLGNDRILFQTNTPDELRKEIMQWALNNDINISALQVETNSLEDVFRSLTK